MVLAAGHPLGDFGFCRYRWTTEERDTFLSVGRPPRTITSLEAEMSIVPIQYYVHDRRNGFLGPSLTASEHRRLNACSDHRLIMWNVSGPDAMRSPIAPCAIPSTDITMSESQMMVYLSYFRQRDLKYDKRTPLLSALLNTGLFAAEYSVGTSGPQSYDRVDWSDTWELLNQFTVLDTLQHPFECYRNPAMFRHPLRVLHQRLVEDFSKSPVRDAMESESESHLE